MLERNGMGDALKTGDGAAGQQARQLSDPKMNFGATEPHVKELEEARAEWRRRHPANPDSATRRMGLGGHTHSRIPVSLVQQHYVLLIRMVFDRD